MKIRTDFVTNSSSSSFVLEIVFKLTNGKSIKFKGNGATYECGCEDYFEGDAVVKVDPRRLGRAADVDELIRLLAEGVVDRNLEDGSETLVFSEPNPKSSAVDGKLRDPYQFVKKLQKGIKTMDDIESITISGKEESNDIYYRSCTYNRQTGRYTGEQKGSEPFVRDGNSGGDLLFWNPWSMKDCEISTQDEDEE